MSEKPDKKWNGLIYFAEVFAECPCCMEARKCHPECTYQEDCSSRPEVYERMEEARRALMEAGL